jgi:Protein of unknown function (DUF5818)
MKAKGLLIALSVSISWGTLGISSPVGAGPLSSATTVTPQNHPDEQTFKGKIVSQNGVRFILRDEQTDNWYHLDDQEKAGKFLGKTVLIKGTLDGASDTIRIKTISEVNGEQKHFDTPRFT